MSAVNHWIVDVTPQNFESEVIGQSKALPIVLFFWSDRSQPCQELGSVLGRKAEEGAGRFLLARVDLDRSPELAQAMQVRGVPAVLAVVNGQLADGFEGPLPEAEVDAFLDRIAPPAVRAGQALVAEARSLADAGDHSAAVALLEDHLISAPEDGALRLLLGDLLLDLGRQKEARAAYEALESELQEGPEGRALLKRLEFLASAPSIESLREAVVANPEDAAARLALGEFLLADKSFEAGFDELLSAVRIDPVGVGVAAKAAMLGGFELLGLEDPIANDYRFKLSLELFA